MADSNSKKPMALLLLVVVAVLVVIMVSGGDAEFAGHAKIDNKEGCEAAKGSWAKAMDTVEATDKAACDKAEGTWADEKGTKGEDDFVAASCTKEAEKESCSCDDACYAALTTDADCKAAHGTFTAAVVADAKANPPVEAADASCAAWVAKAK